MFGVNKNILLAGVIVAALGALFVFRNQISEFLNFGPAEPPAPTGVEPSALSPEISQPPVLEEPAAAEETGRKSTEKISRSGSPSYTGRPPEEIRPAPEEVKIFSEIQRQQLYAAIRTQADTLRQDQNYFNGWIQIGVLKKTLGDFEGARDAWEYAGIIQPLNSLSFANLGELYWRYLPDYPKAEKNLKTSIKHKPSDAQTYVTLAELYHYSYLAKYELADDALMEGINANPDNGTLMRRLAYLYEQRKEYPKALEWWKKVLDENPDDAEVQKRMEEIQAGIGQ